MIVTPIKTEVLVPPQDDLLAKIKKSSFNPKEGDVVAITSKVVSIWQGRCLHIDDVPDKDDLIKKEADLYLEREEVPGMYTIHTYKEGIIVGSSGIDTSNADGYYILWPKNPQKVAEELLTWIKSTYEIEELYVVITDSHSMPFRRGSGGFALSWAGFDPIYDYRMRKDIFGHEMKVSMVNLPDALAASAVLVMGEGDEQTPIVVIHDAPLIAKEQEHRVSEFLEYKIKMDEDMYAPFFNISKWKKGGGGSENNPT